MTKDYIRTVSQVHGDRVLQFGPRAPAQTLEADALWTEHPGVAVAVKTADCVPVLLADTADKRVAAVHSGWRGTELRVAQRAVEVLARSGTRPENLLAVIGPSIRGCCYQVSSTLAERFSQRFGKDVVQGNAAEPRLDLALAIHRTLWEAGILDTHIDVLSHCTFCDKERFYSHRRDRGVTGRHLSYIVCQF